MHRGTPALSRRLKTIAFLSIGVLAATVTAVAFATSATGKHSSRSAIPVRRQTLANRAARYRVLAAKAIARRRRAQHGRTVRAGAAPDPLAIIAMRDVAIELASLNGEARPTNGAVFSSTRAAVERAISDAGVNTDQPAFVAVVRGRFTAYEASVPPGSPIPTGSVMTITFDANSLEVTDWGIIPSVVNTTGLGASTPLGL